MRTWLLLAGLLAGGTAFADTYEYRMADYPTAVGTADDCRNLARTMADEFQSNAGVANALGLCTDVTDSTYDIVIRYDASEPLQVVSTLRAGTTIAQPGFFPSREECEAVLPEEVAAFEDATGLAALVPAYCVDLGGFNNSNAWMFRIEAAGTAEAKPALETAIVFGRIQGYSMSTFLSAIMDGLRDLDVNPRYAKFESSIGMGYVVVYLYSRTNFRFETTEFAKTNSIEACNAELERFKAAAVGTETVLSYCTVQNPTARAEVAGIFLDRLPFSMTNSLDRFDNYEACTVARDSVVDRYRVDGLDVVDGLCGMDEQNKWRVILLSR